MTASGYARARLRLGITGVGFYVLLAVGLLLSGLPARWLPTEPLATGAELRWLLMLLALYALVQIPLDVLGGWWLPRRYGRDAPTLWRAVIGWLRGVATQGVVMVAVAAVMLALARDHGHAAAIGASVICMVTMVALQAPLARLSGSFGSELEPPPGVADRVSSEVGRRISVHVWEAEDEGFTGGWFGLPGREQLVLPARWIYELSWPELEAVLVHRACALASGLRTRGVVLALLFNTAGLALAASLPGAGFATVAELVCTALGATLWSFLGLLVLPSVSRPAVMASDAFARQRGVSVGPLAAAIRRLDRWQDDEPSRTPSIETVFHPLPSVTRRIQRLEKGAHRDAHGEPRRDPLRGGMGGAWHAARMTLFLSWASSGLLARAVHCNAGRPQLWVALPAD